MSCTKPRSLYQSFGGHPAVEDQLVLSERGQNSELSPDTSDTLAWCREDVGRRHIKLAWSGPNMAEVAGANL